MVFLRGPQAWIASAIADALGEFFVVGLDQIESSLTKITLKDVRLKPQKESIPKNTFGKTTKILITGFVREVSVTWSWDLVKSERPSWIKDAVLQLKGCRFKVKLTQEDMNEDEAENKDVDEVTDTIQSDEQDDEIPPEKDSNDIDDQTQQTMTIEERIQTILEEQIELLVNALALTAEDFEIIIEIPSPNILPTIPGVSVFEDPEEDGNIEMTVELSERMGTTVYDEEGENIEVVESFGTGNTNETGNTIDKEDYTISLKVAGHGLHVLSYGRYSDETLKERVSLSSLFVNVTETFHNIKDSPQKQKVVCKTYPLLKPFSYALGFTRTHGERFSDIARGLVVKGGFDTTSATKNDGISIYLDRPQLEAIGQLSGLILAPKEDEEEQNEESKKDEETSVDVSVFDLFFGCVSVDLFEDKLSATNLSLSCLADGSDLFMEVTRACYEEAVSETKRLGISIECSDIAASILPSIDATVGLVDKLYIPDVVELRTPIENVEVSLVGAIWTVDADLLDGYLPSPEVEVHENDNKQEAIPFALACKVKRVFLVKDEDEEETEVALKNVELLLYPKSDEPSTELACSIQSMESKLASATNINTCMVLPESEGDTNTIRNFALSVDNLSVTAGYTIQDWKKTFRIGGKWRWNSSIDSNNKLDETAGLKLPYASVAPVKTRITYSALRVVSVRETTFLVKSYKGNRNTSLKDILDFYTAECLSKTPDFLQNAELLGINVKSAGAFSLGAHFIPSPIGPFVGVAAVVGVDAVRGSIEAGKRSRQAQEGEAARVTDFFRGIGYLAVEATQRGKLRRTGSIHRRGNILDWMVGATADTGEYIGKNKDTLGSAGGAGAGVLVGTILGGPVGAVIGGVVGGMTTGTAIRRIDRRIQAVLQNREQKIEEQKLKPGQLALSPS